MIGISANKISTTGTPFLQATGVPIGSKTAGIKFFAQAVLPADNTGAYVGSYSWVQLLSEDLTHFLVPAGSTSSLSAGPHTCSAFTNPEYAFSGPDLSAELDNTYPYGSGFSNVSTSIGGVTNDTATDGPGVGLTGYSEVARTFIATIYLLWTPPAAGACIATVSYPCTVPVPLGSQVWTLSGDTVNILPAVYYPTSFVLTGCQGCTAPASAYSASSSYPSWTFTEANNQVSCKK